MANPNMSGGDRVCAIYAQKLSAKGHTVNILAPRKRYLSLKKQFKRLLKGEGWLSKNIQQKNHFSELNIPIIFSKKHAPIKEDDIPESDIIIATWWETAEWISSVDKYQNKTIYFVQHYEVHSHIDNKRSFATYNLPYPKITVAKWLTKIMKENFNSKKVFTVLNSVDHEMFFANKRERNPTPVLSFLFSEKEFKGVDDALKVIHKVKEKIPSLHVIAFGQKAPNKIILPDYIELHIDPAQSTIRDIYSKSDIWLCCSLSEGFGLTLLEAMACRTPVVSTKCGGPEDIIIDGYNGYLCEISQIDELAKRVIEILTDAPTKWLSFSDNAFQHAKSYNWDIATSNFEAAIESVIRG
jgi:glycosyltransferase involved in cell wall biosynthesis